jgi:hypothetical protein
MADTSRRTILLGALALAVPAAASAAMTDKLVDPKKAFTYLDAYLKLPPAERSRFRINYYFHIGGQPLTAPVWIVEGARRTPVPLRADGRVERLPTLAQLDSAKLQFGVEEGTKLGCTIGIETIAPPAAEMDAREVAAALAQAAVGVKKAAGIMAMAMPKLSQVSFPGVASGEVVMADGKHAPLPLLKGVPSFKPTDFPAAKTLRFPKAPLKLDMG